MPIFDYSCAACGHTFDVLQKMGEGPLRKCPSCGKLKLKKDLSAPAFHLKGSGWYKSPEQNQKKPAEGKAAHNLDSGHDHGHDHDKGIGHSHSHGGTTHSHSGGGGAHSHGEKKTEKKTHSHGGKTHSHGPGCGHDH